MKHFKTSREVHRSQFQINLQSEAISLLDRNRQFTHHDLIEKMKYCQRIGNRKISQANSQQPMLYRHPKEDDRTNLNGAIITIKKNTTYIKKKKQHSTTTALDYIDYFCITVILTLPNYKVYRLFGRYQFLSRIILRL